MPAAKPALSGSRGFWPSRMAVKPCAVVYLLPLGASVANGATGTGSLGSTTTPMPCSCVTGLLSVMRGMLA